MGELFGAVGAQLNDLESLKFEGYLSALFEMTELIFMAHSNPVIILEVGDGYQVSDPCAATENENSREKASTIILVIGTALHLFNKGSQQVTVQKHNVESE